MKQNQTRFIRVTKDNPQRDRGLIAIDAICSIVENQEANNVSIMTMDGFWYDVVDDLDSLYEKIFGNSDKDIKTSCEPKSKYFRRKKMMTPSTANERVQQSHEAFVTAIRQNRNDDKGNKTFRFAQKEAKRDLRHVAEDISESLPSGEGEGHYDLNPKPPSRELGEGL